jgi:hypothetical protein
MGNFLIPFSSTTFNLMYRHKHDAIIQIMKAQTKLKTAVPKRTEIQAMHMHYPDCSIISLTILPPVSTATVEVR